MADNKCNTTDCGGNCDSCNGDITVTLTLDNDETVECAIQIGRASCRERV